MEEIHLNYEQINKNKFYDLKDIIFECFGITPNESCSFNDRDTSGITTYFAVVYKDDIKCYTKSRYYGPGAGYHDNGWRLYKQYRLITIPDIPFIVSELKKYEGLMTPQTSRDRESGVDLMINILKFIISNDKEKNKEKDKEIEHLKLRIRDEEQISHAHRSKIKKLKLDIKDKDNKIETLKMPKTITEEDEIRDADIKAKLFALKDEKAKERLRMLYEDNISIEMGQIVQEQLSGTQ